MSNQRRGRGRVTPRVTGESGVDVSRDGDKIILTQFDRYVATSIEWPTEVARHVMGMLERALDGKKEKENVVAEVSRASGLVIARGMPGARP